MSDERFRWTQLTATVAIEDNRHLDPNWPRKKHLLDLMEQKIRQTHENLGRDINRMMEDIFWEVARYRLDNGGCRQ